MSWIQGWGNRIKITVDHNNIDETLYNFPILVNLNEIDSSIFEELGDNSKRILIVTENFNELCYCEVERWDYVNKSAQLWIRVPVVTADKDTELYLYYDINQYDNTNFIGNTGSFTASKVWDDEFFAVYHMSQDPTTGTSCVLDSTKNGRHASAYNMTDVNVVDGEVGKALSFNGVDEYIQYPFTALPNVAGGTLHIQILFKRPHINSIYILGNDRQGTYWPSYRLSMQSIANYYGSSSESRYISSTAPPSNIDTFYYLSAYHKNGTMGISIDYGEITEVSAPLAANTIPNYFFTGKQDNGAYYNFIISKLQISNNKRSDAWVKASYHSWKNTLLIKNVAETSQVEPISCDNKIKIVIPKENINETLYNFPILVNLTENSGLNSADLSDIFHHLENSCNRKKIAITDITLKYQYFVEIENWAHAEKSAQLWVKIPELSHVNDTVLYFCYDKTMQNNIAYVGDVLSLPAINVWDENFLAVYHMSSRPLINIPSILDSTINALHGIPVGSFSEASLINSNIGKTLQFNGNSSYVNLGNLPTPVEETLEAIFRSSMISTNVGIGLVSDSFPVTTSKVEGALYINGATNSLEGGFYNGVWSRISSTNYSVLDNKYHYGAISYDRNNVNLILDSNTYTLPCTDTVLGNTGNWRIGARWDVENNGGYYAGIIKEVRISKIGRSTSWLNASYYSNLDKLIIYTLPTPQTGWLKTYENGVLSPWENRIKIEIDHSKIDETLLDFPVLLNISEESGVNNENVFNLIGSLISSEEVIDSSIVLLLQTEDTTVDLSKNNLTLFMSNVNFSSEQSKFGSKSLEFLGINTSIISINNSSIWNFGLADLTIDCWVYPKHADFTILIIGRYQTGLALSISANKFYIGMGSNLYYIDVSSGITLNSWNHIAITRKFGIFKVFSNGALKGSIDNFISTACNPDTNIKIGADNTNFTNACLNGFLEELRIIQGCAIWWDEDNFIPPTEPHTNTKMETSIKIEKIAITAEDGITQLPIEIENLNETSLQMWTKIPLVKPNESTTLYLYYDVDKSDNTEYIGETGTEISKKVWSNNYVSVHHLSQINSSTSNFKDSVATYNSINTSLGNTPYTIDGRTGMNFDGANSYIDIGKNMNIVGPYTYEVLANPRTLGEGSYGRMIDCNQFLLYISNNSEVNTLSLTMKASTDCKHVGTAGLVIYNSIQYFGCTWEVINATTMAYRNVQFFKNDTLIPATLITAPAGSSNVCTNTIIGNSADLIRTFDGTIFEVRISNTIRTEGWLKASYHSIMDELLSYNEVETYVETPTQYYAYEGYVKNKATPVERKVLLYERTTGLLMDATTSDNQGHYLLQTPYNTEHFIVVLDNITNYKFNPLVQDRILPNGS